MTAPATTPEKSPPSGGADTRPADNDVQLPMLTAPATTPEKSPPSGSADTRPADNDVQLPMLVAAVLREVRKSILEEQAARRSAILGIVSIFTVVVVAGGGLVINQLVEDYIDEQIGEYLDSVTFQSQVAALNVRAIRLDQQPGFDENEATDLIQSVATLHTNAVDNEDLPLDVRTQNRANLTFAVATIARSFAAADRQDLVSEITSIAPEITRRSPVMTQLLVQMVGRNLIGAPGGHRLGKVLAATSYLLMQSTNSMSNARSAAAFRNCSWYSSWS